MVLIIDLATRLNRFSSYRPRQRVALAGTNESNVRGRQLTASSLRRDYLITLLRHCTVSFSIIHPILLDQVVSLAQFDICTGAVRG